tara:strand:+ start:108 stop:458 length:351 start_codon:yes stop_codon:yes gene_type:complete
MVGNRGWGQTIMDMLAGVSESEYEGAHSDIDKIIARADKDAELAKLFDVVEGRNVGAVYRHLDPSDSSVSLIQGMVDKWYRNPAVELETSIRRDAMRNEPISKDYVASLLARLRNK